MKKHLTNDECIPLIRAMQDFENRSGTFKGHQHTPGFLYGWGYLPERYHAAVLEATFIVYSYDTPIAWYGPEPRPLTLRNVEKFLAGPGIEELEKFLTGEAPPPPRMPHKMCWQVPAVRYSRTTSTHHVGTVWSALAYRQTWRESKTGKSLPSRHWRQTEYAKTPYDKFLVREASTGGVNW